MKEWQRMIGMAPWWKSPWLLLVGCIYAGVFLLWLSTNQKPKEPEVPTIGPFNVSNLVTWTNGLARLLDTNGVPITNGIVLTIPPLAPNSVEVWIAETAQVYFRAGVVSAMTAALVHELQRRTNGQPPCSNFLTYEEWKSNAIRIYLEQAPGDSYIKKP